MLDIPIKAPGDQFFSDECNSLSGELENAITATGQTLSGADLFQLSKAMTDSTGRADFYTDSGIANAYDLAPQGALQSPTAYLSGLRVRFQVANSNTGPSTVQIGVLGLKPIKKDNNTADLEANDLIAGKYAELVYDQANDIFELLVLHEKSTSADTIRAAGQGYLPFGMGSDFTSSTQFEIQVGNVKAVNDSSVQIFLEAALIKNITIAWAEGNNQGCLPQGLILQSSTYYYVFAVSKANGDADIIIDDNPNATNALADPNLIAAQYINYAEVWRFKTNSVSQLDQWSRFDNQYLFNPAINLGSFNQNRPYNIATKTPPNCIGLFSYSTDNLNPEIYVTSDLISDVTNLTIEATNVVRRDHVYIPSSTGQISVIQSSGDIAQPVDVFLNQFGYIYLGAFQ